jgi:hypothetical protein
MVEKNIIIASLEIARGVTNYGMVRNSDSGSYIVRKNGISYSCLKFKFFYGFGKGLLFEFRWKLEKFKSYNQIF